jgi:Icc protein
MPHQIRDVELFGVTESSFELSFRVEADGVPVETEARVLVDGEPRATLAGGNGTRRVRIGELEGARSYRLDLEVSGTPTPERDEWFPEHVTTLPAPHGTQVASFATLNDLHFGEPAFGGTFQEDGDWGGAPTPEFPAVRQGDTDVPYWQFMNEDAAAEINDAGVDATFIKGDIADRGRPEQFAAARACFSRLEAPHHAFLGNHDHYGLHEGIEVNGYELLGQPEAPRAVELGGWQLVLLETAEPGEHHGEFGSERMAWLEQTLSEGSERGQPTLLLMHHQPVPPEFADRYPNTIGLRPAHSIEFFELVRRHPQVRGVLIGHTHRNRIRRYRASGPVPFIEVNCTKDYPGGWGHYRLYDDGSFRQEVRRTGSERALRHSSLCSTFFQGGYRRFSLGSLAERSFIVEGGG